MASLISRHVGISPDPSTSTNAPAQPQAFHLRPALLSDLPLMAKHNTAAYWNSPIHHHFICPLASSYPSDLTRIFHQKLRRRMLLPNNISLVAYLSSNPDDVVGFAQFSRVGNDEEARGVLRSSRWWYYIWFCVVLAYYYRLHDRVNNFIWKDRITNFDNLREAETYFAKDDEIYWSSEKHPERVNRWQCNSVVVAPEWQGRGVGRMLMGEVLKWAQRERVVVGLTSSPRGEHLYRKLGFEMLGDFYKRIGEEEGGGIMIWYPEGWKSREGFSVLTTRAQQ